MVTIDFKLCQPFHSFYLSFTFTDLNLIHVKESTIYMSVAGFDDPYSTAALTSPGADCQVPSPTMGMDAPEGSFTEEHILLADDIFF